eukprot:2156933-Amphidinium_carterae.1
MTRADVYVCSECNLRAEDAQEFRALTSANGYRAHILSAARAGVMILSRSSAIRCWELHIPALQRW